MTDPSAAGPPTAGSNLRLDPKVAGALCYLFGCLSGLLFFVLEKENKTVRFHALQSLLVFGILSILSVLSVVLTAFTNFFVFQMATNVIWILHFVAWIFLVIRTYQGQNYKVPLIGDIAAQQVGWPEKVI